MQLSGVTIYSYRSIKPICYCLCFVSSTNCDGKFWKSGVAGTHSYSKDQALQQGAILFWQLHRLKRASGKPLHLVLLFYLLLLLAPVDRRHFKTREWIWACTSLIHFNLFHVQISLCVAFCFFLEFFCFFQSLTAMEEW